MDIPVVIKKIGYSKAIWFENSGSFLLFEEPAFDVFQRFRKGEDKSKIIDFCTRKYGRIEKDIPLFVDEVLEIIRLLNRKQKNPLSQKNLYHPAPVPPALKIKRNYRFGNKKITLAFQNKYMEWVFHPQLAHLEEDGETSGEFLLELFSIKNHLLFRANSILVDVFKKRNIEYFTGAVKQQIFSIMYGHDYHNWMMALHASGVIRNKRAVLFSASGGSGKSTLAAILKAKGWDYLSDDFVMADKQGMVYPVPSAISVKNGAVAKLSEFYPVLQQKTTEKTFTGKEVRFIPVFNQDEIEAAPYPVKALVFVSYDPSAPFLFETMDKKAALANLLKETWINPTPTIVSAFFEWLRNTNFYRLRYSETEDALHAVGQIFGKQE